MAEHFPNVIKHQTEFLTSIGQTLEMMFKSGSIAILIGLMLGVLLVVTRKGGILENRFVYQVLDKSTNIFRSIPFVILIFVMLPVTRFIVGSGIGVKGAIVPLVVGCVPFFMRQVDMALSEVDAGRIDAAQAMGLSPVGIIFRVYLRESIPSLVRAITITLISLLGLTAMAGAIGGGGIGDFVMRYGHAQFLYDITFVSVLIILLFVSVIQGVGNLIIKKTTH